MDKYTEAVSSAAEMLEGYRKLTEELLARVAELESQLKMERETASSCVRWPDGTPLTHSEFDTLLEDLHKLKTLFFLDIVPKAERLIRKLPG